jgi:hypothetical protein
MPPYKILDETDRSKYSFDEEAKDQRKVERWRVHIVQ